MAGEGQVAGPPMAWETALASVGELASRNLCRPGWLELWVVLHTVDADKVRAVAAAVPNWIGVACHLLHDAPVVAHTDGITLCKRLRSDSRLDGIENVISSTNIWLVVGVRRNLLLRN